MTDARWFTDYWPWWVALIWLGGFEVYAWLAVKVFHVQNLPPSVTLLSYMVWEAFRVYPWAQWIVAVAVGTLLLHFYIRKHEPFPMSLALIGLMILGAWVWSWFTT